ncbi:type I-F CRISPR-associated helicase Cas3, partial [Ectothiorhodospira sp. 9100]|nr:type I-F CRISPR-associated helicase Cas3 [Ectothiorhodospira sp. 9100]MCG5520410.1 type I-F CRISPR-associated helicase Cas3 [Ectothiorhodospira sp. 9905]
PAFQADQLNNLPAVITADWNEMAEPLGENQPGLYWSFPQGLPVITHRWRERARQLAERFLKRLSPHPTAWLDDPYTLHLARLTLMLADHHYSSLEDPRHRVCGESNYALYANTIRKTGRPNQPLDEHLLGVEKHAATVARAL